MTSDTEALNRSLGRMEGKIDLILSNHADQEKRLSVVEKRQYTFMGYVAAFVTAITFFGGKIREAVFG